jgi:hypothetical protein
MNKSNEIRAAKSGTAMKKAIRAFASVPVVCGLLATVLFVIQGGVGAGHGNYDLCIFVLGLPSILLIDLIIDSVEVPAFLEYDLLIFIVLPTLMNLTLFGALGCVIRVLLVGKFEREKGKAKDCHMGNG